MDFKETENINQEGQNVQAETTQSEIVPAESKQTETVQAETVQNEYVEPEKAAQVVEVSNGVFSGAYNNRMPANDSVNTGYMYKPGYYSNAPQNAGYAGNVYQSGIYQGNSYQSSPYQGNQYQGNSYQNTQSRVNTYPGSQYQSAQYQNVQNQTQAQSKVSREETVSQAAQAEKTEVIKKEKKQNPFWKKLLAVATLGIVFGLCAGITMLLFEKIGNMDNKVVVEEQKETESTPIKNASEIEETNVVNATTVVTDVTEVVEVVMPSVVSITNTFTSTGTFFGQSYSKEEEGSGSGIIVNQNDTELLIVTNYHVVQDADSLKVQFINDDVVSAALKGVDSNMDLAVIAVNISDLSKETKDAISVAKIGDSNVLTVGEPAIAIGNALGYGQSVTTGVISALDRQIEMDDNSVSGKLIQTDAAINPGNSGGALLNVKGEVVGINSNKIGGSIIEGMGYAIPISSAMPIIEELMLRETKNKVDVDKKGTLGIKGLSVTSDVSQLYGIPEGVFITTVYEGMAAQRAGIIKSDVITGFDGISVGGMEDLQGYLEYYEAGETVPVTLMRVVDGAYEEMEIDVVLGSSRDLP